MDGGLLSLKWNNHRVTFFHVLTNIREKNSYNDVTLACDGKFYPAHKMVLSTCSDYFEQMFENTQCKHPVIVLKDIKSEELELLLDYMYIGEVNVIQDNLSGLIKAAECLKIKGLAVPDEEPESSSKMWSKEKRTCDNNVRTEPKRRRHNSGASRKSGDEYSEINARKKPSDLSAKYSSDNIDDSISKNVLEDSENSSDRTKDFLQVMQVKTEDENFTTVLNDEVTIDEPSDLVKQELMEDEVYLSDSNSATEIRDLPLENSQHCQQHFMDQLLGQDSGSQHGQLHGEFVDTGAAEADSQHHAVASEKIECKESEYFLLPGSAVSVSFKKFDEIPPPTKSNPDAAASASAQLIPQPTTWETLVPPFVEMIEKLKADNPDMTILICPICGYKAKQMTHFMSHYMIHSEEKPYACPHCPYRARQAISVKGHMSRRHTCLSSMPVTIE